MDGVNIDLGTFGSEASNAFVQCVALIDEKSERPDLCPACGRRLVFHVAAGARIQMARNGRTSKWK